MRQSKFYPGVQRKELKGKAALKRARADIAVHNSRVSNPLGIASASVFQGPLHKGPEKKFVDNSIAFALVAAQSTFSALNLLNGIAQGTDSNQHIGRQAQMKSFYWRWQGSLAATTAGTGSARLLIVYDKEAEGAPPTIATGAQTDILIADRITGINNLNNRDRFIVLVDEVVECIGTQGPSSFYREGYRKIDLPMVWNASTAATIAAINTGSIYAGVCQSGGLVTANAPTTLETRICFTDA